MSLLNRNFRAKFMHDDTQVEAKQSGVRDAGSVAITGDRRIDLRETESRFPSGRLREHTGTVR